VAGRVGQAIAVQLGLREGRKFGDEDVSHAPEDADGGLKERGSVAGGRGHGLTEPRTQRGNKRTRVSPIVPRVAKASIQMKIENLGVQNRVFLCNGFFYSSMDYSIQHWMQEDALPRCNPKASGD
jgi:hypothetical protein